MVISGRIPQVKHTVLWSQKKLEKQSTVQKYYLLENFASNFKGSLETGKNTFKQKKYGKRI